MVSIFASKDSILDSIDSILIQDSVWILFGFRLDSFWMPGFRLNSIHISEFRLDSILDFRIIFRFHGDSKKKSGGCHRIQLGFGKKVAVSKWVSGCIWAYVRLRLHPLQL